LVGKKEILILRMMPEDKRKITGAAQRQGKSITDFVTQTALKEAKRVLLRKEKNMETTVMRPSHGGIPTFFRALCLTASQGGTHSYKDAGYSFGMATVSEIPFDADFDEWNKILEGVRRYIEKKNREGIWQWYRRIYPHAMELVPNRKKDVFVDGILEAHDDGKLWFI
jgi:hypothetical protein